jgi:hypothetical protein
LTRASHLASCKRGVNGFSGRRYELARPARVSVAICAAYKLDQMCRRLSCQLVAVSWKPCSRERYTLVHICFKPSINVLFQTVCRVLIKILSPAYYSNHAFLFSASSSSLCSRFSLKI